VAPVGWPEGAAAALLALLGLALPVAASPVAFAQGFALLASATIASGSDTARVGVTGLSALLVLSLIARPGRWPARLLPAVGLGALGAALLPVGTSWLAGLSLSRAPGLTRWPLLVVCFAAVLLFFSCVRERPCPRWLLAGALAVAACAGLYRLAVARSALAQAAASPTPERFAVASERAREAGWAQGERDARIGEARALVASGRAREALERLPDSMALDARVRFTRGEAMLALGQDALAMDELSRGLNARVGAVPQLSAEGLARVGLWEARFGRSQAGEHLGRGAEAREPARYLAELAALEQGRGHREEAARIAAKARTLEPESPFALCLDAELTRAPEAARACLQAVPSHEPSLEALAAAGDAGASQSLQQLRGLPARKTSFGGTLELLGARLEQSRARPGETVKARLLLRIASDGAPGEQYGLLLEQYGPLFTRAEMPLPVAPRWVRGELVPVEASFSIPAGAPAGSYRLQLGIYAPESDAWLPPNDQPGHISVVPLGDVEVAP
jgi:tetratricopeptide (TPR) repeat protein